MWENVWCASKIPKMVCTKTGPNGQVVGFLDLEERKPGDGEHFSPTVNDLNKHIILFQATFAVPVEMFDEKMVEAMAHNLSQRIQSNHKSEDIKDEATAIVMDFKATSSKGRRTRLLVRLIVLYLKDQKNFEALVDDMNAGLKLLRSKHKHEIDGGEPDGGKSTCGLPPPALSSHRLTLTTDSGEHKIEVAGLNELKTHKECFFAVIQAAVVECLRLPDGGLDVYVGDTKLEPEENKTLESAIEGPWEAKIVKRKLGMLLQDSAESRGVGSSTSSRKRGAEGGDMGSAGGVAGGGCASLEGQRRELEGQRRELEEVIRGKDAEIERLRALVYGVEVMDVETGVTRVVVKEEGAGAAPPRKRMRQAQAESARVMAAAQERLVEVKREHAEERAAVRSELRASVDAKVKAAVKETLAEVAEALECACCLERLAPGAAVALECGHTYCNRAACASSSVTACPECQRPIGARVPLFGALASVCELLPRED